MKAEKLVKKNVHDAHKHLRGNYGDFRRSLIRSLKEENKELSRIIHFFKKERSRLFKAGNASEGSDKQYLLHSYVLTYISNHLLYNALRGCDPDFVYKGNLSHRQRSSLLEIWGNLKLDTVSPPNQKVQSALMKLYKLMHTEAPQAQEKMTIMDRIQSFFGTH